MTPKRLAVVCALMLIGLRLGAQNPAGLVLTASTDAAELYVHAQLVLTIEIKTEHSLRNGSLSKPQIENAIVEQLVENEQREVMENGVKNIVFIRSYAIFPTEAGTLSIPSVAFEGSLSHDGHPAWNDFFGRGQRIAASTKPIQIKVKPIPSAFPKGQPFLPAKSLTVVESFDDENPKLMVNKAMNRRFEIRALGSLASFLPSLKAPVIDGVQIYSENGSKTQKATPDGLMANVNFSHVYLPSRPGKLSIPEQTIYWWDTDLDQLQTTLIRPLDLEVGGEVALTPTPASPLVQSEPEQKEPSGEVKNNYLWPSLALLFFLLWLLTLAWALAKKYPSKKSRELDREKPKLANLVAQVISACEQKCAQQALNHVGALKSWAKEHSNDPDLIAQLNTCSRLLEDALYGGPSMAELPRALSEVPRLLKALPSSQAKNEILPGLYPL